MSITVVNDYDFKPDGDVDEGKAAAAHSTYVAPTCDVWRADGSGVGTVEHPKDAAS